MLLSDYKGNFVNVDLRSGIISMINMNDKIYQRMGADIEKLRDYKVCKIYSEKKKAIVYFLDSKVGLIDYNHDIKIISKFEKENFYDFDWAGVYTAKISENKIEIIYGNSIITYDSPKNYNFLRGKIVDHNGKIYIYILSALKADVKRGRIEKMELNCNN